MTDDDRHGAPRPSRPPLPAGLTRAVLGIQAGAGLLGACGVGLAAAAAHKGGGELTAIAANVAILHAASILAVTTAAALSVEGALWLVLAAASMTIGTILFSGELALAGLSGLRPWPFAAPFGGSLLIVGWVSVFVVFVVRAMRTL